MKLQKDLVSIIIRTCERPNVLRRALESVRKQTYSNIEVVVVEDGRNAAQLMIETEFSDMNICYFCIGERKGRTVAGNIALSMAAGKYFNFLDDDDLLFPQHVEILVSVLEKSKEKAAYALAYESVVVYDKKNDCYKEKKRKVRFDQPFNRVLLTFNNYIPIQSIMFDKELYRELGGFDESLEVLEDWDMWVRYSTKTDFIYMNTITSLYRVPAKSIGRDAKMNNAYGIVTERFGKYGMVMNYYNINKELEYILNVVKTPSWKRKLKKIRDQFYERNIKLAKENE